MQSENVNGFVKERIASIDALRGFDMFWIIGGQGFVLALIGLFFDPIPEWLRYQFTHVSWIGFSAWDLIMPLFLFITGLSMPFSFSKRVEHGGNTARLYLKIVRRTLILFVLGMVAQGNLLDFRLDTLHVYSNTLQAIAVGYLVASMALLNVRVRGQIALTTVLLTGYWLLMAFVPFGGHPAGTMEPDANLALHLDNVILGKFSDGTPYSWLLSGMTFSASVLLGVLGGELLRSNRPQKHKLLGLVAAGVGCLMAGWLWGLVFPINKHLWTSSMTLWAAGWSYLLLALFYGIIDMLGFQKWAFPFKVIGMNAIGVYMATHVVNFRQITDPIVGGFAEHTGPFKEVVLTASSLLLIWLILLHMYRKKIFVRV